MLKEIATYQFKQSPVRIIPDSRGELWFVAKDVCNVLGLKNPTMALKPMKKCDLRNFTITDGKGISRMMRATNESGLYQLTLRSTKPKAKEFQYWVTHDVLPSIRKTGSYFAVPNALEQAMASLANTFNAFMASTSTRLNDIEARLVQPTQVPKLLSQATLSKRAQFNMAMREMAKALNISYRECYGEVYKRYYYTNHINLKERAKNTHTRPIDVAEQLNCFDDLINICQNFH